MTKIEYRHSSEGQAASLVKIENSNLTHDQLQMLLVWFSPSFPVGSFAYSHSLETAVEKGAVVSATDLETWIKTVILMGSGRSDGVIFREAYDAASKQDRNRLLQILELSNALFPTAELALESRSQGAAFQKATVEIWSDGTEDLDTNPTYPVATAFNCAEHKIPIEACLISWYHALAASLVSAGVRLIPLGQTQGLRVLASLSETIRVASHQAKTIDLDDIGSAAPLMDIDSMHHETQYTRLFRS